MTEETLIPHIRNPYKMKPVYFYKFECGCLYSHEEVALKNRSSTILCIKHREKVVTRYIKCRRCDALVKKARRGFCAPVCDKCLAKVPNVYLVNLKKLPNSRSCKTPENRRAQITSQNRYNCKYRNECLSYSCSIAGRALYLPCWRCVAYEPVPIELETFREGTFESLLKILYI